MSAQRGFAPIAIIAVIAVVLLFAGAFFYFQKSPSSTLAPFETSNTQTTSSSEFSFEISDKKLAFTGGYADPSVIYFKGQYFLYLNKFGSGGSANFIYTSTDGSNWTDTGKKVPGGPTKRAYVDSNKVRLYYPTNDPIKPSDPPSQILSAVSSDGLNFIEEPGVRVKPTAGYTIEGPTIIKLNDNSYRMYFSEYIAESMQERKGGRIIGASSDDGVNFTRDNQPSIESDPAVEKSPADWPQVLRPFVVKRPDGGYVMFYNSHSKIFAAYSEDGMSWKKLGGLGIKGADVDAYYLPDGNIRINFGDFSEQTSGVVYTGILKEVKERTVSSEVPDAPGGNLPMGSKPQAPPGCVGKSSTDPNLPQECQMWFRIQ